MTNQENPPAPAFYIIAAAVITFAISDEDSRDCVFSAEIETAPTLFFSRQLKGLVDYVVFVLPH